jgi:hypothetical protein
MKDGLYSWCKSCWNARVKISQDPAKRNAAQRQRYCPAKARDAHLRKKYGLSSEDYDFLLLRQGGKCACCGGPPTTHGKLVVDHSHQTGKVRALLCSHCNTLLGMAREDPSILKAAISFLETHG